MGRHLTTLALGVMLFVGCTLLGACISPTGDCPDGGISTYCIQGPDGKQHCLLECVPVKYPNDDEDDDDELEPVKAPEPSDTSERGPIDVALEGPFEPRSRALITHHASMASPSVDLPGLPCSGE